MSAQYTYSQLVQLAESAGFGANGPAQTAAAIALAESGGDPTAVGDRGTSFGLWQVHLPAHPDVSPAQAFDPAGAARAAYQISNGGRSFTPWSTFTSGAYLAHLPGGTAAAVPAVAATTATNNGGGALGVGKWLVAFGVLSVVLLVAADTEYRPVAAALAGLIAVSVVMAEGGRAWNELTQLVGTNPAAPGGQS